MKRTKKSKATALKEHQSLHVPHASVAAANIYDAHGRLIASLRANVVVKSLNRRVHASFASASCNRLLQHVLNGIPGCPSPAAFGKLLFDT